MKTATVTQNKRPHRWLATLTLTLAAILFISNGFGLWASPVLITHYSSLPEKQSRESLYPTPKAGMMHFGVEVNEARTFYANTNVVYLLELWLSDANGQPLSGDALSNEYQRLMAANIPLYQVEVPLANQQMRTAICCVVNDEALADFPLNADYGYFLDFTTHNHETPLNIHSIDELTPLPPTL